MDEIALFNPASSDAAAKAILTVFARYRLWMNLLRMMDSGSAPSTKAPITAERHLELPRS